MNIWKIAGNIFFIVLGIVIGVIPLTSLLGTAGTSFMSYFTPAITGLLFIFIGISPFVKKKKLL